MFWKKNVFNKNMKWEKERKKHWHILINDFQNYSILFARFAGFFFHLVFSVLLSMYTLFFFYLFLVVDVCDARETCKAFNVTIVRFLDLLNHAGRQIHNPHRSIHFDNLLFCDVIHSADKWFQFSILFCCRLNREKNVRTKKKNLRCL